MVAKVKMKTSKSVASRFKVTATGKLKHARPGKRHILTKKSGKCKRHLSKPAVISERLEKTYKRLMCV